MTKQDFLDLLVAMGQQAQAVYQDNSMAPAHRALAAERVQLITAVMALAKQLKEGEAKPSE